MIFNAARDRPRWTKHKRDTKQTEFASAQCVFNDTVEQVAVKYQLLQIMQFYRPAVPYMHLNSDKRVLMRPRAVVQCYTRRSKFLERQQSALVLCLT